MSPRRFRVLAAALVAGAVALIGGGPAYADATPSPNTSPTDPPPPSHDISIGGGTVQGRVGQDAGAHTAVNTDGAQQYTIGIEIVAGAQIRNECDRVASGFCWFDRASTAETAIDYFRFSLRNVGTHEVDVVVDPSGYVDPDLTDNRATLTFTVAEAATGRDMSITGGSGQAPVGETATARVVVDRAGVENYTLLITYDPTRLTYLGRCHDQRRVGQQTVCMLLPEGFAGSEFNLRFTVIAAGPTVVPVAVQAGPGEDPYLENNSATVTINPATPTEAGGQGGAADTDSLPVTGAPAGAAAASGVGLGAVGAMLFAAARRRESAVDLAA